MSDPLAPLIRHHSRDRGMPDVSDFQAAGLELVDGNVFSPKEYLGLASEFGIVGQAWDKQAGVMRKGRCLVQWSDTEGEVLRHAYEA